jgi:tripartite-type tricarboxylate transporter receptor subunit TctC
MTDVRSMTNTNRRRFLLGSTTGIASLALGLSPALSQQQPVHATARVMVGFPAGGPSDVTARLLAEHIKPGYATSTIVENRAGAGGRVVMDVLKNSPADGSVMVITPSVAVTLYPHVYKTMSYTLADFAPVSTIHTTAMLLAVGPTVPAEVKTLADFIAWCKANPRQANFGSPGAGSPLHFLGVMLGRAASFEYLHVPFQGTAPSVQALLGGQIASAISPVGAFVPQVKAGTLRALAFTGAKRSPQLPDVPTMREAGFPALEFAEWFGVFVPARTPAATVERLSSDVRAALRAKAVMDGFATMSVDVAGHTPADFAVQIKKDTDRWAPIVKESGFTPLD